MKFEDVPEGTMVTADTRTGIAYPTIKFKNRPNLRLLAIKSGIGYSGWHLADRVSSFESSTIVQNLIEAGFTMGWWVRATEPIKEIHFSHVAAAPPNTLLNPHLLL